MGTGQPNASAPESAEEKSTHEELNQTSKRDNQHVEVVLRHSEANLNSILNSAMDAIITVDEKQRVLFFNHAAEKMFLCSADEAIGQPLERFIPERFRTSHIKHIKGFGETDVASRVMASTRAVSGLRADGEEFPVEASISQAEVEGEKLFTVILRDITERVRAEKRFHQVIEHTPNGVVMVNKEGIITLVNAQIEKTFGYDREELLGQRIDKLIPQRFHKHHATYVNNFMSSPSARPMGAGRDLFGLRKDGTEFPVEIGLNPIETEQGVMILGTIVDITERKRAENSLRKSEELFRSLALATSQLIWRVDDKGNEIEAVNWESITGFENDMKDRTWRDLVHPDDLDRVLCEWNDAQKNLTVFESEHRLLHGDGTYHYYVSRGVPIFEDGNLREWIATVSDITERKRAEDALNNSERRFRALIEYGSDSIALIDADNKILYVSPAVTSVEGYAPEELIGRSGMEHTHPDDYPLVQEIVQKLIENPGKPIPVLWRRKHKNGQWLWLEGIATNLLDDPAVGAIVTNYRDITERKCVEEEIRNNQAQLEAVFQAIQDGIVMTDMEGNFLLVNEAEARITGFPSADAMKESLAFFADIFELTYSDGRLLPVEEWPLSKILKGQSIKDLQLRGRRLDTGQQWVFSYSGEPVFNKQGEQIFAVVSTRDITEQKEAEEMILRMNEELEQRVMERTAQLEVSNKELESFSYSVSHDLRAPLRHINGFSQALLEDYGDRLDEEGRSYLREVRDASKEMADLIDDMLQLARITRSEMNKDLVNLSKIVNEILAQLKAREPEREAKVNIEDGLLAYGDQRLLGVMLNNLLGNAWKFTSKKDVSSITFGRKQRHGQPIYYVRDNGAGFDMKYADKLFGVFQRLHRTDEFEGTGVGLAIVQRVVLRHGGQVWAESVLNEGATFYFTLSQSQGGSSK